MLPPHATSTITNLGWTIRRDRSFIRRPGKIEGRAKPNGYWEVTRDREIVAQGNSDDLLGAVISATFELDQIT